MGTELQPLQNLPLTQAASTNPSSPEYLSDDSYLHEYYSSASQYYYYSTYSMSSSDYHLIWLYTESSSDDFDLYLYSDSSYSDLVGSSLSSSQWDWLVYRPASSQSMYPKVYTYTGYGYAYIEAESGYDMSVGSASYITLSASETAGLIEVSLSSSVHYLIGLNVPSGCDYDLYVFRTSAGSTVKQDYHSSASSTTGADESIAFTPLTTDTYAIVILRKSGSGTAKLSVQPTTNLADDVEEYVYFDQTSTYYYFDAYSPSAVSYYHLIWLYAESSLDDFDLTLYSDPAYYSYQTSSYSDQIRWIVHRPSSTEGIYPAVYSNYDTGYAYIEVDSGDYMSTSTTSYSKYFGGTDHGDIFETWFYPNYHIEISLTVPAGSDFDLYVFRVDEGSASTYPLVSSASSTLGQDESLSFRTSQSDCYAIVVIVRSGSGSGTLTISRRAPIPSFEFLPIFLALAISILLLTIHPRRRNFSLF